VTLGKTGRVRAADWIPVTLGNDGLPRRDRSDASAHLMATLSREDFPNGHWNIGPHGRFRL
jgi:hypothetical protein